MCSNFNRSMYLYRYIAIVVQVFIGRICFWLTRCLDEDTFSARKVPSGPRLSFRRGGCLKNNLIDTLRVEKVTNKCK